jgi:hypothetical protein
LATFDRIEENTWEKTFHREDAKDAKKLKRGIHRPVAVATLRTRRNAEKKNSNSVLI